MNENSCRNCSRKEEEEEEEKVKRGGGLLSSDRRGKTGLKDNTTENRSNITTQREESGLLSKSKTETIMKISSANIVVN